MRSLLIFLAVTCLSSCSVMFSPPTPSIIRNTNQPIDSSSQNETALEQPQPNTNSPLSSLAIELRRRTIYIASYGHAGDADILATLKSELTQKDSYYARFAFIDLSIDQIRLDDRANIAIDMLIRTSERFGAELALLFENPPENGVGKVSLSFYCVQNSELIASSNQRRKIYDEAGGFSQALEVATQAALEELVATYIRRVEQGESCPQRDFEER